MTKTDMKTQAEELASKGRYGDSMLVHMNPAEVRAIAELVPGGLTLNPDTGQPEAFLPFLLGMLGGAGAAALPATLAATAAPAAAAAALPALAAPAIAAPTLAATALPAATAASAAPAVAGLGALEAATPALAAAETAAALPAAAAPQQVAAMGLGDLGGFNAAQQAGAIAAPPGLPPAPIDPGLVPGVPTGPTAPFGAGPNSPLVSEQFSNAALKGDLLQPTNLGPQVDPLARIPQGPQGAQLPKISDPIPAPGAQPSPPPITAQASLAPPEVAPYGGPQDIGPGGPQDIAPDIAGSVDDAVYGAPPPPGASAAPAEAASDFSLSSITSSPFFLPGLLAAGSLATSSSGDSGDDDDEGEGPDAVQPEEGDYTAEFPGDDYVPGRDDEFNYFPNRSFKGGGMVEDIAMGLGGGLTAPIANAIFGGDDAPWLQQVAQGIGPIAARNFADGGYIDPRDRVSQPDSGYRPGTDPAHVYFPERAQPAPAQSPGVDSALQALANQNAESISRIDKQLSFQPKGGAGGGGGGGDDGGASQLADGGTVSIPFSFEDAMVSGQNGPSVGGPGGVANPLNNSTQSTYSLPDALAPVAFANGGGVGEPMMGPLAGQDPRIMLMMEAEKAMTGQHPDPEPVITQFVQTFGEGALRQLAAGIQARGTQGDVGRMIEGPGGPKSDDVPARIDDTHEAALSNGEFVMTADAVKNMGGGDPMKGAQMLTMMNEQMGGRAPTGQVNVNRVT